MILEYGAVMELILPSGVYYTTEVSKLKAFF